MKRRGVVFKDINTYRGTSGGVYPATNESMDTFHSLLKDQTFDRAAGICSAGEIGLFVLLPRVKRQLTLIDHSYATMGFALLKVLLIKEVGGKRAHELITKKENGMELLGIIENLKKKLPGVVQAELTQSYKKFINQYGQVESYIVKEWFKVKPEVVASIENKLDLVEFVHGDLTDLKSRKPFDLLYLSNALEYRGRDGNIKVKDLITSCVKPGGLVLSTHGTYTHSAHEIIPMEIAEIAEEAKGLGSLSWVHAVHKLAPAVA